ADQKENKPFVKAHHLQLDLETSTGEIVSVRCHNCEKDKEKCQKVHAFLLWIQQKQKEVWKDVSNDEPCDTKKIKRERRPDNVLRPVSFSNDPEEVAPLPALPKLKKETVEISPVELESAMKLSMFNLIREFQGDDPVAFLEFCTKRMQQENCSNAQLLTVEQADTDLWHELRKGRITASRMHEASRCTMLNGSLTNKIMGISSGFSFAMQRGTDLEGHVFNVLKKQYPSLRNTGLVLDPQFPWMGASPDGIADDFVLEIKCPYTPNTFACYIDVNKLSKKYFAQIQLQMHMTHRTKALLGVAALDFERSRKVTQVWIDYDKEYVDGVMEEAFEFWSKGVFPALKRKRKTKK
ncbi:uncharacterized protein LOC129741878, partial [Uranotaenia lowii]|uniref:uncharacterized protein LOC129741878 n=1 Tax=Uranotaenia lowii TaxID=190385 RepID=UPI00247B09A2